MYSPNIIDLAIAKVKKKTGRVLIYHPVEEAVGRAAKLEALRTPKGFRRELKPEELEFILNEQMLCGIDFTYFAERYGVIHRDGIAGGGVGRMKFWNSQKIAMSIIAKREEEMALAAARGDTTEGILAVWHKARQLGATMLARLIIMHRMTMFSDNRSMAASVDEKKIQELYDRDKTIYEHLPFYLRPDIEYDKKAEHIYFNSTTSRILYHMSSQKFGLGTGQQFELSHHTELSHWTNADEMLELDFFPTIPQSAKSLCILESTAKGRGNWWHVFSEEVRKGHRTNWVYIFIPWYAEAAKYRRTPPVDWVPSKMSQLHASRVADRSTELIGHKVLLSKENLHWYETERTAFQRKGTLNIFLSNYCATPEESFQHSTQSAFPPEFLEKARLSAMNGVPYEHKMEGRAA